MFHLHSFCSLNVEYEIDRFFRCGLNFHFTFSFIQFQLNCNRSHASRGKRRTDHKHTHTHSWSICDNISDFSSLFDAIRSRLKQTMLQPVTWQRATDWFGIPLLSFINKLRFVCCDFACNCPSQQVPQTCNSFKWPRRATRLLPIGPFVQSSRNGELQIASAQFMGQIGFNPMEVLLVIEITSFIDQWISSLR